MANDNVSALLAMRGGGSVTPETVLSAMQAMSAAQEESARSAINAQTEISVVTDITSNSITLAYAADNTIYEYGELTNLTVTAIANPGDFIIIFTSGATATTTNFPAGLIFSEAFAAEANTRYEINVRNGYALVAGWPTT